MTLAQTMCANKLSMIPVERLEALAIIAQPVTKLIGALVECGSWNGGSAALLASAAYRPGRHVWLFDSWEGMPEPSENDGGRALGKYKQLAGNFCVGDMSRVSGAFWQAGVIDNTLHIRKGWFQDTLPLAAREIGKIALLHIDADWYDSVAICLRVLYPQVKKGGLVIIDDYGHWPGCRLAVDEYFSKAPVDLLSVDYTSRYFFKETK
jgi:SAM-dependent methyltransferase